MQTSIQQLVKQEQKFLWHFVTPKSKKINIRITIPAITHTIIFQILDHVLERDKVIVKYFKSSYV